MASPGETLEAPGVVWRRGLAFASVIISASLYGGATTVANAVLPQMQGDLSASLDQISWVITASVVAGAIGTPPTPWLASRFGHRQLFIGALVAFTISSTLIGFSSTLSEVVVWRIVQAVTGAPLMALSQTFTLNLYPGDKRPFALAIWTIGLTCGWVFAPAIGAYLADQQTWRLIFLIMAPVGGACIVMCLVFLPKSEKDQKLQFDWLGFFALSVALASLQIVLNRGQRLDWFDSTQIVIWAVLGVVSLYFFVIHSLTTKKPFFNWQIFRDRSFTVGTLLTFTFSFISLPTLVMVPAMLAELRGLEVVTIGFIMVPRGCVQLVVTLVVARLIGRVDARALICFGFVLYAAGTLMMSRFNLSIGLWDVIIPMAMQGAAMSIIWLPVFNMMYATLEERYRTDGASVTGLAYSLTSSAGLAVSVTLISRGSQTSNEELASNVILTNELLRYPEYSDWDLSAAQSLASIQAEVAQQALMISYVNVFWLLSVVCLAAIPIVILFGTSCIKR